MGLRGAREIATPASFDPAHGRTTRAMFAPRAAINTTSTFGIRPMDSVSHCPRKTIEEEDIHEYHPARDAVRDDDTAVFCSPGPGKACSQGCLALFRMAAERRDD